MPSAQNQIQIVDTHETSETLVVTRLQRVGYQINRTLLTMHTIEIRTYRLKPGVSAQFEAAMQNALPMVRAAMDVVAFGRTDHEGQTYFLIRAYSSKADLKLKQDFFYSALAWRDGPREPLVQCIDTYLNTIVEMSEQTVDELRSQDGKGLNAS